MLLQLAQADTPRRTLTSKHSHSVPPANARGIRPRQACLAFFPSPHDYMTAHGWAQQLLKCTVKLRMQVYSSRIATLESRVLLDSRPRASLTKELHLLSNDLKRE